MEKNENIDKKRRKKLPFAVKILIAVFAVCIVVIGCASTALLLTLNRVNKVGEEDRIAREEESFEKDTNLPDDVPRVDEKDIIWKDADKTVMQDKDVVNIMLIGQDKREGQGRQRSDSMILATFNKKEKKVMLTSFMRDLYVQIPGYSDNRINAAYAFGGMSLLDSTIEKNFGIHVDGNVEVDFQGFEDAIDILGGVAVELNQAEADHLNQSSGNWKNENSENLGAGIYNLTGEQALAYARIRYVGNSDYERTDRQRQILLALFEKMKQTSPAKTVETINQLLPHITTDLSNGQILGYAWEVVNMHVQTAESYRIPVDGAYQSAVVREMMVLIPDLEKNQEYLRKVLYNK